MRRGGGGGKGASKRKRRRRSRVGEQRFMSGEGYSEGAEGNSRPYYRWGSPGRVRPGVFQASPAYFTAVPSGSPQCHADPSALRG